MYGNRIGFLIFLVNISGGVCGKEREAKDPGGPDGYKGSALYTRRAMGSRVSA